MTDDLPRPTRTPPEPVEGFDDWSDLAGALFPDATLPQRVAALERRLADWETTAAELVALCRTQADQLAEARAILERLDQLIPYRRRTG